MATEETYKRLRFSLEDRENKDGQVVPLCRAWRGKAKNPYAYFRFRSTERRRAWIGEQKASEDASQTFKVEQEGRDAEKLAEQVERIQVGTILYTSWGYDQTNVEFFQVVERKGKRDVILREIAATQEETGNMSGNVTPRPGQFIGEPERHRIGPYGIRIDYCRSAWVHEGGSKGNSWYH